VPVRSLSEPFSQAFGHSSKLRVDLAWRGTKNQAAYSVPSELDIRKTPQDVYFGVGNDDSGPGGVLNGILGFTLLTAYTADTSAQVIAVKSFHILDFKGLEIEVIET
jgi:hypothetical protein